MLFRSKINKTKVDASIIESALEMYKIDNGSYPETVEALVDEYLKTEPVDPWGDSYVLTEDKSAVVIPEKAKDKDGEDEG